MSTTYVLQFDTGNAAFVDYGRDAEVATVIRRAADKIERDGLDEGFKVYDTNGNSIGHFAETTPPVQPSRAGEVVLSLETGNAAFEDDPVPEVLRILRHAAKRIEQGDWPTGLLDINGNAVGSLGHEPPEVEVPEDVEWISQAALKKKYGDSLVFSTDKAVIDELAQEMSLEKFGECWTVVAIARDEDEVIEEAWIAEDDAPEKFAQVAERYVASDWARDHEDNLKYGP